MAQIVLEALLKPFEGTDPAGQSLRYDVLYDQIREARRQDDGDLPQGVWKTEVKRAEWDKVFNLTHAALVQQSKDLQLAAWLTEANLHTSNLPGMADGLDVIIGLTESFWDSAYPKIEADDTDYRLVPYDWLNDKLSEQLYCVLITAPEDKSAERYTYTDWIDAQHLENQVNRSKDSTKLYELANQGNRPTLNKLQASQDQTPTAFYRTFIEDAERCLEKIDVLDQQLQEHLGEAAPSFYKLRENMNALLRMAKQLLDNRGVITPSDAMSLTQGDDIEGTGQQAISLASGGAITTRAGAYQTLALVADFLARIEPHSPTPYLVRRAIAWGNMSLAELYGELLNDKQDLPQTLKLLGINIKERSGG